MWLAKVFGANIIGLVGLDLLRSFLQKSNCTSIIGWVGVPIIACQEKGFTLTNDAMRFKSNKGECFFANIF